MEKCPWSRDPSEVWQRAGQRAISDLGEALLERAHGGAKALAPPPPLVGRLHLSGSWAPLSPPTCRKEA